MSEIVGYTFNAENYTHEGVIAAIESDPRFDGWQTAPGLYQSVEANLDEIAYAFDLDRDDEHSFDSGDFPKRIWDYQVDDAGEFLTDADGSQVFVSP